MAQAITNKKSKIKKIRRYRCTGSGKWRHSYQNFISDLGVWKHSQKTVCKGIFVPGT